MPDEEAASRLASGLLHAGLKSQICFVPHTHKSNLGYMSSSAVSVHMCCRVHVDMQGQKERLKLDMHASLQGRDTNALVTILRLATSRTSSQTRSSLEAAAGA